MQGICICARSELRGRVTVALQSADGTRTYARQRLSACRRRLDAPRFHPAPRRHRPERPFRALAGSARNRVGGSGYLSETGKALFHGLPVRADIGEKLVGGRADLSALWRHDGQRAGISLEKDDRRPRDQRPQYRGHWYPQSTNGFGIEEFLQFCEAAHIEPAFAINIDETPEDAADLVEYLNGPATSVWGAKRAANGHPRPYHVRYIEIGNEEAIDGNKALVSRAIWNASSCCMRRCARVTRTSIT